MMKKFFTAILAVLITSAVYAESYDASGNLKTATDLKKVNGTTVDTNSGTKSAGTQRVVLATDQPTLTNAIPVSKSGTWDITNAGTFAVQAAITAALNSLVDGAIVTLGAKADAKSTATDTTSITAMQVLKHISASVQAPPSQAVTGTFFQATQPISAASATIASGSIASGALASGSVASGAVASGAIASGAIAAGAIAAGATSIADNEDVASADADRGVKILAVRKNTAASTSGTDGDYQPLITNTTGHLWVDASGQTLTVGSHAVTNAGTFVTQDSGDKAEDAGHSSADTGLFVLGVRRDQPTAALTSADNEYSAIRTDQMGSVIIAQNAAQASKVRGALTTSMTGTTSTSLIAASGNASLKTYVTHLTCTNGHASVSTYVNLQDGSGGTALWSGYAAAVGGGFDVDDPNGLAVTTANTALFVVDVTTGADVRCAASGFLAP